MDALNTPSVLHRLRCGKQVAVKLSAALVCPLLLYLIHWRAILATESGLRNNGVDLQRGHSSHPRALRLRFEFISGNGGGSSVDGRLVGLDRIDVYNEYHNTGRNVLYEVDPKTELLGSAKREKRLRRDAWPPREECSAKYDWQSTSFPNCNHVHEHDLTDFHGRIVANGYFRDVWMVHDIDGKRIALKTLRFRHTFSERNFDRHRRDALATERLTPSSYVVNIHAYCANSAFFRYSDKGTAHEALERNPSKIEILRIAMQIALGISAMHNLAIAHTDIKLNQFILINDTYVLNDFNRARLLSWDKKENKTCGFYVTSGQGKKFRSPEEYAFEEETEAVDVYSMGNCFYMLLTKKYPFHGVSDKEAQKRIMNGERPYLSPKYTKSDNPIDDVLVRAMHLCWIHDPAERADAREIAILLSNALRELENR